MQTDTLRFNSYELELNQRRLLRDGREVPLRAKAFDVLVALVQRAGRMVTKSELLDAAWPGLVVEENNVAMQIVALRKALDDGLIVTVPGYGYRFQATIGAAAAASSANPTAPAAQQPATPVDVPPLIGRDADLTRLLRLLRASGCLTLVGTGGVGKTALARALRSASPAASAWVDLAELATSEQVVPALYRALAQTPPAEADLQGLADSLQALHLVVLDSAEHLVEAVAKLVRALLNIAPSLRVLVTSQVPLAIREEQLERIEPLAVPAPELADAAALSVGAMALFVRRIREADARFQLAASALPALRRLCSQLDGLPLMIEMAAARVPLLGVQRVCDALSDRLSVLRKTQRDAPARHRSVDAALAWSYGLLAPAEQRAFRGLGVFARSFSAELAVRVVGAEPGEGHWDAVDRLAVLVDRSLVASEHADPPRYHLLETMRRYALAQLARLGEEAAMRTRHADALDALLDEGGDEPSVPDHQAARRVVLPEMSNVRDALGWAMRHHPEQALRMSARAAEAAVMTVWRVDAREWLVAARPHAQRDDLAPRVRSLWWRIYARYLMHEGHPDAVAAAESALAITRVGGDAWALANAWVTLALAHPLPDDAVEQALAEARELCDRHPAWPPRLRCRQIAAEARAHEIEGRLEAAWRDYRRLINVALDAGLQETAALATLSIADLQRRLGRYDAALQTLDDDSLDLADDTGYVAVTARVLSARIRLETGQPAEALAELPALFAASRRLGITAIFGFAALVLAHSGRPRAAALVSGRAERYLADQDPRRHAELADDLVRASTLIAAHIDADTAAALVERGRSLDERTAARILLDEDESG